MKAVVSQRPVICLLGTAKQKVQPKWWSYNEVGVTVWPFIKKRKINHYVPIKRN